jgi:hypothetical protein
MLARRSGILVESKGERSSICPRRSKHRSRA